MTPEEIELSLKERCSNCDGSGVPYEWQKELWEEISPYCLYCYGTGLDEMCLDVECEVTEQHSEEYYEQVGIEDTYRRSMAMDLLKKNVKLPWVLKHFNWLK